jgi:putative solute:sodium symporter small subunit
MPANNEKMALRRTQYWRQVRLFTAVLIALWFSVTFGIIFFARELSALTVFGWPFSFYMAAQGLTLFYLFLVGLYVFRMRRLDKILKGENINVQ